MFARNIAPALFFVVAACGGAAPQSGASSADDVDGEEAAAAEGSAPTSSAASLPEGTEVCINKVLGMRYPVEDALREYELEPVRQCTTAEIMLEETGAPGSFVMRYQKVGDADWQKCESAVDSRVEFVEDCTAQMVQDLGSAN